jgi:hypothetical protein
MAKKINTALEEKVVKSSDPEAHKIHTSRTASQSSINKSESSKTKSSPKKIY